MIWTLHKIKKSWGAIAKSPARLATESKRWFYSYTLPYLWFAPRTGREKDQRTSGERRLPFRREVNRTQMGFSCSKKILCLWPCVLQDDFRVWHGIHNTSAQVWGEKGVEASQKFYCLSPHTEQELEGLQLLWVLEALSPCRLLVLAGSPGTHPNQSILITDSETKLQASEWLLSLHTWASSVNWSQLSHFEALSQGTIAEPVWSLSASHRCHKKPLCLVIGFRAIGSTFKTV